MTKLDIILKSRDIILPTKVHLVKAVIFPVVMYGCESWTTRKLSTEELMLLNYCVGEDSWESLDSKEVQPVNPKGNQPWIFIGRTDTEAETAILWPPDVKSWLIGKDPDPWTDWRREEKGTTEDEMVGWHSSLNGYEFWVNSGSWWWTGRPGILQSMGSRRVGPDWATSLSLFTFMHWRRKWQPTPVFLPGESQGRGSLVGCHRWGRTESDMSEAT